MSDLKLSQKADIALSDLTSNGGLLLPEQADTFYRYVLDEPTLLNRVRTVQMNAPTMNINRVGIGTRVLHGATQAGGMQDSGANARWLAAAKRTAVYTNQIQLATKEVIAEIRIPYEVLEDNIERGNFTNTILALVAQKAALDFEEMIISGDTSISSGVDDLLCLQDGVLKRFQTNVVDAASAPFSLDLANRVKKALPTRYRRNLAAMGMFLSMDKESDYRVVVAGRGTPLGDAIATGGQPVPVLGMPLVPAAKMPDTNIVFTDPKNIIWGLQRSLRIETDKDIRSREFIFVLTARVAIQIEDEVAGVKLINLG